jgi:hypothetical protein
LFYNQSLALLRRDIHVKSETIDKYTTQLEAWSSELLRLESKGREVAKREREQHQVRGPNDQSHPQALRHDSDDDMSDKDMFEEV